MQDAGSSFLLFWSVSYGIPDLGSNPCPQSPVLQAQSVNHWTTKEVPTRCCFWILEMWWWRKQCSYSKGTYILMIRQNLQTSEYIIKCQVWKIKIRGWKLLPITKHSGNSSLKGITFEQSSDHIIYWDLYNSRYKDPLTKAYMRC